MLSDDGTIDFSVELVDALEQVMKTCESRLGQQADDLERGLTVVYLVGLMCCDLEAVWQALADHEVFGQLDPRHVYEECAALDAAPGIARRQRVMHELTRRGLLPQRS